MSATLSSLEEAGQLLDELITPAHLRDPIRPLLALEEDEACFRMHASVPTLRPEDLRIRAGEHFLEITAAHREARRLRCCLIPRGPRLDVARRYPLRRPIVPGRAEARLVGGRLELCLPKRVGGAGAPAPTVELTING